MNEAMQKMYDWIAANPDHNELEIARGVGLKRTPYTRTILLYLWNQGCVVRYLDDRAKRPTYRYFIQLTQPMEDQQ